MTKEYVIMCQPLLYPQKLEELRKDYFESNEFVKNTQHDGEYHYVTTGFYFEED